MNRMVPVLWQRLDHTNDQLDWGDAPHRFRPHYAPAPSQRKCVCVCVCVLMCMGD